MILFSCTNISISCVVVFALIINLETWLIWLDV